MQVLCRTPQILRCKKASCPVRFLVWLLCGLLSTVAPEPERAAGALLGHPLCAASASLRDSVFSLFHVVLEYLILFYDFGKRWRQAEQRSS